MKNEVQISTLQPLENLQQLEEKVQEFRGNAWQKVPIELIKPHGIISSVVPGTRTSISSSDS